MSLRITYNGFEDHHDSHIMHYDKEGNYLGQTQDNMLDDSTPFIYISAETDDLGRPCVNGNPVKPLTQAEMDRARADCPATSTLRGAFPCSAGGPRRCWKHRPGPDHQPYSG